jgi:hypothetical protein
VRQLMAALLLALALASCCAPIGAERVDRVRSWMSPAATDGAVLAGSMAFLLSFAIFIGTQICVGVHVWCHLRGLDVKLKRVESMVALRSASLEVGSR